MSLFKCKMCGGTLELNHDETVGICEYCGTRQTLPKLGDEQKANLYERANHLRRNNEYDKAMGIYEQILNADRTDAESYWSIVLCRYGIEYVEDPASHKRIPTVNRAQFTSIFADEDYKSAVYYADALQKEIYEQEAKAIDDIQKGILAISSREEPFDVFICYKETDANGRRTPDSVLATDLYHQLKQEGFKVFFSRITLEDKLGVEYEPYIFAALNSAKVMVVLGTKPEYFNAVWVKNEWSRYLALIKNGARKMLIPAYRDMDPYDLPDEFSHLQAQDMGKLGFMQDLIRGIKKITATERKTETVVVNASAPVNTSPLLKRVFIFLEDGDFVNADEYCEKVLDNDPENAEAYLGKMMAELHIKSREELSLCEEPFDENANYKRALRFADEAFAEELRGYISAINERKENCRLEALYKNCVRVMEVSETEEEYINAAKNFEELGTFGNSSEMAKNCRAKAEEIKIAKLDAIYKSCIERMDSAKTEADYKTVADLFRRISGFRDADEMAMLCLENAENARLKGIYASAKSKMSENTVKSYAEAIDIFRSISEFGDSENQIYFCQGKIEEIKAKEAEEKLEREREAELKKIADRKRRENAKRLAKIWTPIVAGVLAFAILLNFVVIPNFDYIKAEINTMVEEAKAEKAEKDTEKDNPEEIIKEPDEEIQEEEPQEPVVPEEISVGSVVTFGSYEQDNNLENGAEPIEWQVLDIQNGKALFISKYVLAASYFDDSGEASRLWEYCSLRKWLNGVFIENAFNAKEENLILKTKLVNHDNPEYGTDGGNDTEDKVFLLSIDEAEKYFSENSERKCKSTSYANEVGEKIVSENICCYWLRSSGVKRNTAAFVFEEGVISKTGYVGGKQINGVRPAMWVDLAAFEEPQEPIIPEEISVGDAVTFGSYEQDNNLENGAEPIEWQVLDIQDGKALVISKYGLDCKPYDSNKYGTDTWETCSLRKWLNNKFFNNAFSSEEQKFVQSTELENPDNLKYDTDGGNATKDKIFLFSIDEAGKYLSESSEGACVPTAYAKEQGAYSASNGNGWWWLRSPGAHQHYAARVAANGIVQENGFVSCDIIVADSVSAGGGTVRPAMWVDLAAFEEPQEPVVSEEISVGDVVTFGSYEQDNDLENGKEPIEWQVLDVKDGKALVISKYGLDCKRYNKENSYLTWETCSLRNWLNNEYINEAFIREEQKIIATTKLSNLDNPRYGTDGGKDTEDKVFLLSIEEMEKYFSSNEKRKCKPSIYAIEQGAYVADNDNCWWWLRSNGYDNSFAADITVDGVVSEKGIRVRSDSGAVRPAMWIFISEEQQEPVVSEEISVGNVVTFGSYEQDNNLENGAEPIEWQVLDVQNGKTLVISKYGLDCQPYNAEYKAVTWETCSLRKWLNSDFINSALNTEEQKNILITKITNPDNPKFGTEGGSDTLDKIFILSIEEAEKYFTTKSQIECKATNYAKARKANTEDNDNCWWWLRTLGTRDISATAVKFDEIVDFGYGINVDTIVVRPAMWIDLSMVE